MLTSSRNPFIVDDVHPDNSCDGLLEKADILYAVPYFKNNSIGGNEAWCAKIRFLNKTIGLHGIRHSYHEFDRNISMDELDMATDAFKDCFKQEPKLFRPPYNLINKENEEKIANLNMAIYKNSFIAHPYCHCNPAPLMRVMNWALFC